MRVLAVDPGKTTGVATFLSSEMVEVHNAGEVAGQFEAIQYVEGWLEHGALDYLVCESFRLTPQTLKKSTAGSLMTIEIIGALRWLAYTHHVPFVTQAPADALMFDQDNQKLRKLGWWTVGSDHARSASRHMMYFLVTNRHIDPHRVLTNTPSGS